MDASIQAVIAKITAAGKEIESLQKQNKQLQEELLQLKQQQTVQTNNATQPLKVEIERLQQELTDTLSMMSELKNTAKANSSAPKPDEKKKKKKKKDKKKKEKKKD
jgi:hypothetical protein